MKKIVENTTHNLLGEIALDSALPHHALVTFLNDKFSIAWSQFVSGEVRYSNNGSNSLTFRVYFRQKSNSPKVFTEKQIDISEFFLLFNDITFNFKKRK